MLFTSFCFENFPVLIAYGEEYFVLILHFHAFL
jgi:hypothetical protein